MGTVVIVMMTNVMANLTVKTGPMNKGVSLFIARPTGVHYNHCVSPSVCPSVRGQLVKMLITLESDDIF